MLRCTPRDPPRRGRPGWCASCSAVNRPWSTHRPARERHADLVQEGVEQPEPHPDVYRTNVPGSSVANGLRRGASAATIPRGNWSGRAPAKSGVGPPDLRMCGG